MKVSTKGRYAIRVMLDLAVNNTGEYIPLKDVSERQGITLKYLEQIIILLKRSGYLKSSRGNGGGYKLAKAPKEYTIGDILRTTEGSLSPVACLEDDENMCPRSSMCTTINFWEGLDKVINDYVDSVTLQDLLDRQQNWLETTTAYKRIKETERTQTKEQCMMQYMSQAFFFYIKTGAGCFAEDGRAVR